MVAISNGDSNSHSSQKTKLFHFSPHHSNQGRGLLLPIFFHWTITNIIDIILLSNLGIVISSGITYATTKKGKNVRIIDQSLPGFDRTMAR
jgi:hypothetical protein